MEIARQLTLIEQQLFSGISPNEFQNLNFTKKDKSFAPNNYCFSQHFNMVSRWFIRAVMSESSASKRVEALKALIDIATHFCALQNYNGMMEVASAWSNSSVFRLRKTWAKLPPKYAAKFRAITDLTASTKNYRALRTALAAATPPCVPYIGVYQTDLTFLEEGNATTVQGGSLVNWQKCRMQAKILLEIRSRQITPYKFVPIHWMQEYFRLLQVDETDDDFWAKSLLYEPKVSSTQQQQEPASGLASDGSESTETFQFLLRGQASFLRVPYPEGCFAHGVSGTSLRHHIYEYLRANSLAPQPLVDEEREQERVTLVLFSGAYRYGVELSLERDYSLAYLHSQRAFLTGFRDVRDVEVVYPEKIGPTKSAKFKADAEAPLLSLVTAINNAFGNSSEFLMVKVPAYGERKWLNANLSLTQQCFCPGDKIVVVFTEMFTTRVFPEKTKKLLAKNPENKTGFLTKLNVRLNTRNTRTTGASPRQRFDDSTTFIAEDSSAAFDFQPSQLDVSSPQQAASQLQAVAGTTALSSSSSSLLSALTGEKGWFLLTDGLLYYFKDFSSSSPRRVWALDYCSVALEFVHSKYPVLALRVSSDYPFDQPPTQPKIVHFSSKSEAELRGWWDVLRRRSRRGYSTAVFGVPMGAAAARSTMEAYFPVAIRRCIELLMARGLDVEGLFTGTPAPGLIEHYRELVEAGGYPDAATQPAELIALASLVRAYYAELPEPLIIYEMCGSALKGVQLHTEGSRLAVMALMAALPSPAMFGLLYLVSFLRAWSKSAGSVPAAVRILSQMVAAGASVDEAEVAENSPVIAEELLEYATTVYIPREKCVFRSPSPLPTPRDLTAPITALCQAEIDIISRMVTSSVPVANTGLGDPSLADAATSDVVVLSSDDDEDRPSSADSCGDDDGGVERCRKRGKRTNGGTDEWDLPVGCNEPNLFTIPDYGTSHWKSKGSSIGTLLKGPHATLLDLMDECAKGMAEKEFNRLRASSFEYGPLVDASLDAFLLVQQMPPPQHIEAEERSENSKTVKSLNVYGKPRIGNNNNNSSREKKKLVSTTSKFKGLINSNN